MNVVLGFYYAHRVDGELGSKTSVSVTWDQRTNNTVVQSTAGKATHATGRSRSARGTCLLATTCRCDGVDERAGGTTAALSMFGNLQRFGRHTWRWKPVSVLRPRLYSTGTGAFPSSITSQHQQVNTNARPGRNRTSSGGDF